MTGVLLAISWEPEIRGIVLVIVMLGCLVGTTYMVLGTNLGARLGLLHLLAAFFGFIALLACVWWAYGSGLRGEDPTWVGKQIFYGAEELKNDPLTAGLVAGDGSVGDADGWVALALDDSKRGQASASSDDILLNRSKLFTSTADYTTVTVYDKGGKSFPKLGACKSYDSDGAWDAIGHWFKHPCIDQLAFKHTPHYVVVEVQPNLLQNTEPGQAPPTPATDDDKQAIYVLMLRDLGTRRRPPALIAGGSGLITAALLWMLHGRDKRSMAARAGTALVKA